MCGLGLYSFFFVAKTGGGGGGRGRGCVGGGGRKGRGEGTAGSVQGDHSDHKTRGNKVHRQIKGSRVVVMG